jgi:hypothetical protein
MEKNRKTSIRLLIGLRETFSRQIWIDTYTSSNKTMAITLILIKIINCFPRRKA